MVDWGLLIVRCQRGAMPQEPLRAAQGPGAKRSAAPIVFINKMMRARVDPPEQAVDKFSSLSLELAPTRPVRLPYLFGSRMGGFAKRTWRTEATT